MTEIRWRKPGKWMTLIPDAIILRRRIVELQEELRQLGIILRTAEQLEQEKQTNQNSEVANDRR